jgi:hypothetical protein
MILMMMFRTQGLLPLRRLRFREKDLELAGSKGGPPAEVAVAKAEVAR